MHITFFTPIFVIFISNYCCAQYQVQTDEVFVIQLSPSLFNLSDVESSGRKMFLIIAVKYYLL